MTSHSVYFQSEDCLLHSLHKTIVGQLLKYHFTLNYQLFTLLYMRLFATKAD